MKLRYYFLLPNLDSARELANDLLLARVADKNMHFLAKRGTPLGELHEASMLQKSDFVHGAVVGLVAGAAVGALVGIFVMTFPPADSTIGSAIIPLLMLIGALLGVWVSSMIGASTPNSHLKMFDQALEQGRILLMLDVPQSRAEEVRELIKTKHPEASDGGQEPMMPVFP